MDRLHQQLKYFVSNKVSTDGLWKGTRVILSGHETPGEGEHKIMDFIRHVKSLPGYDAKTAVSNPYLRQQGRLEVLGHESQEYDYQMQDSYGVLEVG